MWWRSFIPDYERAERTYQEIERFSQNRRRIGRLITHGLEPSPPPAVRIVPQPVRDAEALDGWLPEADGAPPNRQPEMVPHDELEIHGNKGLAEIVLIAGRFARSQHQGNQIERLLHDEIDQTTRDVD